MWKGSERAHPVGLTSSSCVKQVKYTRNYLNMVKLQAKLVMCFSYIEKTNAFPPSFVLIETT